MKVDSLEKHTQILRTIVLLLMIALAAVLRIAPHPWNLTPVGAMALFSGAMLRDRRLAFLFPTLALVAGDIFIGFHKLSIFVYASFLINVLIGRYLKDNRTVARIGGATVLASIQFFLVTNFAVWAFLGTFPQSAAGLLNCYIAGFPLFWNTLAGDVLYVTLLFGGFAIGERLVPAMRQPILE
jgi:hypothetical protein